MNSTFHYCLLQRPGDTDDGTKPEMRRIVNSALYSDTDEDAGSVTDVRVCAYSDHIYQYHIVFISLHYIKHLIRRLLFPLIMLFEIKNCN